MVEAPVEGERLGGGRLAPWLASLVAGKAMMVADGLVAVGGAFEEVLVVGKLWGSCGAALVVPRGEPAGKVSSSDTEILAAVPRIRGRAVLVGLPGEDTWVTFGLPSSWTVSAARAGVPGVAVQVTVGVTDADDGRAAENACRGRSGR
jgi:hypothetical protein